VPNSGSNTVDVIDPATFQIVGHFSVGKQPQHVTPSYDLKTLWVNNDQGNSLTPIDPTALRSLQDHTRLVRRLAGDHHSGYVNNIFFLPEA
jgi:YVTN family beta-propeller protein